MGQELLDQVPLQTDEPDQPVPVGDGEDGALAVLLPEAHLSEAEAADEADAASAANTSDAADTAHTANTTDTTDTDGAAKQAEEGKP